METKKYYQKIESALFFVRRCGQHPLLFIQMERQLLPVAEIQKTFQSFLLVFFSILVYLPLQGQSLQDNQIDIITRNIIEKSAKDIDKIQLKKDVVKWSSHLSDDGHWSDINYDSRKRGLWDPGKHLQRVRQMAEACMLNVGDVTELHQKVENAVLYWINRRPSPKSDNWYYETISLPLDAGYILLYMQHAQKQLSEEAVNGLLTWMKKSRKIEKQTTTTLNRILAIGEHYILRGCVTKDESLIKQAVDYANQMMEPDSGYTGIQADYSFLYHGNQLYIQGYGATFLRRIAQFYKILAGSSYTLSNKNFQEILEFAHKTFFKLARGQYLDYTVAGRGVARRNNIHAQRLVGLMETYRELDSPLQKEKYNAAINRFLGKKPAGYKIIPEHLHLWSSDYSAHIRPKYFVGLRMVSTRTVKPERGNGENILEHFRGNGAMSIMVKGNEYDNIFPVWKWNRIPGTTVPALKDVSGQEDWFFNFGKTDFVGGVTDGVYGVSAYDMDDYDTQAKKSWFFFDRQIVCLGAGISSNNSSPIYTTINQSISNGPVEIETLEGKKVLYDKDSVWSDVKVLKVKDDEVGYSFPDNETVQISNKIQTGSWGRINDNQSLETIQKKIFTLYIDHGIKPKKDSYCYIVWPGIASLKEISFSQISVLSNTEEIQAVYQMEKDIFQGVFYRAGELAYGKIKLRVDKPCLIMIQNLKGKTPVISVSDPTHQLSRVEIMLERGRNDKLKVWQCDLPQGKLAGKSIQLD